MSKYTSLRDQASALWGAECVEVAPSVSDSDLRRAHEQGYLEGVIHGTLAPSELRKIGFPWSPALIERSRRSTGATLAGALDALSEGRAANLAGGTHHAGRARGGGYCVFNDSAVTLKTLESRGLIRRGLVIDLDVHQGDGTAEILTDDPRHFCFSMHGARNYPFRKAQSDLDIALDDGVSDEVYLDLLSDHLPQVFERGRPDLVVFLAGADPFREDRLGRLQLSKAGLAARDALVFEACDHAGVPVVISMGGGYAPRIQDIVDIHLNTLRVARGEPPLLCDE